MLNFRLQAAFEVVISNKIIWWYGDIYPESDEQDCVFGLKMRKLPLVF
jgi:hypothetical protein